MTVGEQIRACRKAKRLSMRELAELIGADAGSVSRWEHGGGISLYSLERICKALGVTIRVGE